MKSLFEQKGGTYTKVGDYYLQTADKVKVSGQIFCKKPFQITRNMV